MIDIVTVVFKDELPILKVQAQSVERYCADLGIQHIYVIVNDDDNVVNDIDPKWWGSMSGHVKIIPRSHYHTNWADNGWVTQQILKLLAAGTSGNTWSMILDAKTILIRPVEVERIFDRQGRLTWGYYPIQTVFEPAGKIVGDLFGINLYHVAGPAGVPFFFHNESVRDMLYSVNELVKKDFVEWFQDTGMVTEFILYSGYIQARDGTLDRVYQPHNNNAYLVCNICHSEVGRFNAKFNEADQPNILTVSIHRNAWNQLSDSQRNRYREFLIKHNITQAKDLK